MMNQMVGPSRINSKFVGFILVDLDVSKVGPPKNLENVKNSIFFLFFFF